MPQTFIEAKISLLFTLSTIYAR